MRLTRRRFLKTSGLALSVAGMSVLPREVDADDLESVKDLRVAVVGVRSRGVNHLVGLSENVVAICDPDQKMLTVRGKETEKRTNRKIELFSDYRRLLERDDIDALSIATPNHQHAIIAIAACQAGKHVYVEKPISHNIWEGRQLVSAAERFNRVVQCGTQGRSSKSIAEAVNFVRSGELGQIEYVLGTCYKPRKSIGQLKYPLKLPKHVDFDLWCGPAEKQQIYRPSLHYDWHWDFNTGNGDLGNQGAHQVDTARWFLDEPDLPPRVISVGGRVGYQDAGDTPNTQVVLFDYKKAPLLFEVRGLPKSKQDWPKWKESMDTYRGMQIGVVVQCEKGYIGISSDYGVAVAMDNDDKEIKTWNSGLHHHYRNWLLACATGDQGKLYAPIIEGHRSTALCHAGNISHRLGQCKPISELLADLAARNVGDLMMDSIDRMVDHLERNEVSLDKATLTSGSLLQVDGKQERFKDDDEANQMLTRDYRKPFVVPDMSKELSTIKA